MAQFERVVDRVLPAIFASQPSSEPDSSPAWSEPSAEAAFFKTLAAVPASSDASFAGPQALEAGDATWRRLWSLYAAALLLSIALGFSAYRVGVRRSAAVARSLPAATREASVEERAARGREEPGGEAKAGEREARRAPTDLDDRTIASLRRELGQQSSELARLRALAALLESGLRSGDARGADLLRQRNESAAKAAAALVEVQALEAKLREAELRRSQQALRVAELEAQASDLAHSLHNSQETVEQQKQLLAHDQDIRELIGARDLYISEIYDVARTGVTQKPYGRVFYTKGKSLVFYAYDLDQQAGWKNPSSFQAWGRRGPDRAAALSLGLFNADNAATKRWVLRFADAKALTEIDAVYVTVEPSGGSERPSTQPLLFAYLRVEPNHP
jgi:hypothetical protein